MAYSSTDLSIAYVVEAEGAIRHVDCGEDLTNDGVNDCVFDTFGAKVLHFVQNRTPPKTVQRSVSVFNGLTGVTLGAASDTTSDGDVYGPLPIADMNGDNLADFLFTTSWQEASGSASPRLGG